MLENIILGIILAVTCVWAIATTIEVDAKKRLDKSED